jgi:hypothetical protein
MSMTNAIANSMARQRRQAKVDWLLSVISALEEARQAVVVLGENGLPDHETERIIAAIEHGVEAAQGIVDRYQAVLARYGRKI